MKLVIAEKPSVAKSYAEILGASEKKNGYFQGNGYVVSWALGHLAGFEEPTGNWKLDELPLSFSGRIVPLDKGGKEQYEVLEKLMNRYDVDGLVNGTDAGREGEAIFRYIYEAAGCTKPVQRLWISSMTDEAIRTGFDNLQDSRLYDNLYEAAKARDKADSIVGMNGTRLFTILYKQGGFYKTPALSVGRVQTPTLAMIVARESEIKNFKKQKYFKVHIMADVDGKVLEAVSRNIDTEEEANSLAARCGNTTATVTEVTEETKGQAAPRLYDLTSLQRDCNRLFGYTAKETLDGVQNLYESKLCTYPRTDSQYITDDMESEVSELVQMVAKEYEYLKGIDLALEVAKCVNNKKVSDHHAIIPTNQFKLDKLNNQSEKEKNIMNLICLRLVSATQPKHTYKATKVILTCENEEFKANGKVVVVNGFKEVETAYKVYASNKGNKLDDSEEEKDDSKTLPVVTQGDNYHVKSKLTDHLTQPPKSFTEDTILLAMEKAGTEDMTDDVERQGLGTTATRAAILENLLAKGYIVREKKKLLPTERGIKLISIVPDKLKSPKLTADMENTLSLVAKGQASASQFLKEMEQYITDIINANKNLVIQDNENPFGPPSVTSSTEVLGHCPNCNGEVKNGKFGAYCTKKCGMNLSKHFGKQLSVAQVKSLLAGKSVTYTSNGWKNTILSEVEECDYSSEDGKKHYQWKSTGEKVKK